MLHMQAVLVKGDTMSIKDLLKEKGGRWNGGLKSWLFPGSKKAAIIEDLQSSDKVKSVEDKTGGAAPAAAASQPTAKPVAKAPAKRSAAQTSQSGERVFELVDDVRVSISTFAGANGVDIRKFYTEKVTGELRPTPKGIRVSKEEWDAVCTAVPDIDAALQKDDEKSWKLISDITISITAGAVDLRRYYVDKNDGLSKPGKKGIRLGALLWPSLKAEMPEISKELDQGGGPPAKKAKSKKPEVPEIPEEAETPEGSAASKVKWKHELRKILKGRDLKEISLRKVRGELEAVLSLPADGLLERKDEVKEIVTEIIQSGEAGP
ncbi:SUB1 [Symbiodinium sp. CCMP2592]|nr:SUB1 [Symbiodinium sp. CCMP2592]